MKLLLPTKKLWFSCFLACSLLNALIAPLFAQIDPAATVTQHQLYLPVVHSPIGLDATDNPDDELVADDDEAPAVVESDFSPAFLEPATASATQRLTPQHLAELRIPGHNRAVDGLAQRKIDSALALNSGRQVVVVRLRAPALATALAASVTASALEQGQAQQARIAGEQAALLQSATQLDANVKVLGHLQNALNALILEIAGSALPTLAADATVVGIDPVVDYTLAQTAPISSMGAQPALAQRSVTGAGVTVAVVDSGIDYTHAHLGGPGMTESYQQAYGTSATDIRNQQRDGLFPTAKVVEGTDFVGELWPTAGPLQPDNDPIDIQGHGTHVAAIIGGQAGVAPGVKLLAVKACASTVNRCSGAALLQALDYVLDPNGDGNLADRADIVNLAIEQSNYGLPTDTSLAAAVEALNRAGVIVVAAAGNGGDKPYVAALPGVIPGVLAVAETQPATAVQPVLEVVAPATIAGLYLTLWQSWSAPLAGAISGPVQYGDGTGSNGNGCLPFAPGTLTGKVVVVDSGVCSPSIKISNLADGGALVGIIARTVPGDPVALIPDGGNPTIPAFNIRQIDADLIKRELAAGQAVTINVAPDLGISLAGVVSPTSARGPALVSNAIKPEIAAPGGTVSAVAGSGTGVAAFYGTSSAAPVVAGALALLRQAHPKRSATELKAALLNTAENAIYTRLPRFGGELAPITRIGSGELRVDQALSTPAVAWVLEDPAAVLSFGFTEMIHDKKVLKRVVNIHNDSDRPIRYEIDHTFRFANDALREAVEIETPDDLLVQPGEDRQFEVTMIIRGEKLPDWQLNSGSRGADAEMLTQLEFDGYLTLTEEDLPTNQLRLPWQVLPRKGADVSLKDQSRYIRVRNRGLGIATVESYSLIATDKKQSNEAADQAANARPETDLRYVGYATYFAPGQQQICGDQDSFILAFAVNTWGPQTHANTPTSIEIHLDTNRDGVVDYVAYTFDRSLNDNLTDGRNMTWVQNVATRQSIAAFFTVHETNSANSVLYICAEDIGLTLANRGQPINLEVKVLDLLSDRYRDSVGGITIAPHGERYHGIFRLGGVGISVLLPRKNDRLQVIASDSKTNNTENGLLLLFHGTFTPEKEAGVVRVK